MAMGSTDSLDDWQLLRAFVARGEQLAFEELVRRHWRMGKDLPDIAYLSVLIDLDVELDIKPICDRFGTSEVLALIQGQIEGLKAP